MKFMKENDVRSQYIHFQNLAKGFAYNHSNKMSISNWIVLSQNVPN